MCVYFLIPKRYGLMLNKMLIVVLVGDWIWKDSSLSSLYLSSYHLNKC